MTGPLMRLQPHWRIPPDAPVFALMLLSRRRDLLHFEARYHRNYLYFLGDTPVFLFTKI